MGESGKIGSNTEKKLTFFTDAVRISDKTSIANAYGTMLLYSTLCIDSTRASEARVLAFLINTCKVIRAFGICGAFRLG